MSNPWTDMLAAKKRLDEAEEETTTTVPKEGESDFVGPVQQPVQDEGDDWTGPDTRETIGGTTIEQEAEAGDDWEPDKPEPVVDLRPAVEYIPSEFVYDPVYDAEAVADVPVSESDWDKPEYIDPARDWLGSQGISLDTLSGYEYVTIGERRFYPGSDPVKTFDEIVDYVSETSYKSDIYHTKKAEEERLKHYSKDAARGYDPVIPISYKQKVETPESIESLGLKEDYIRLSYEFAIGFKPDEQVNKEINELVLGEVKALPDTDVAGGEIYWYKKHGTFEGKSWEEFSKTGDYSLEVRDGAVVVISKTTSSQPSEFDKEAEAIRQRWSGERGLGDQVAEGARFIASGFLSPDNLLHYKTIGELLFGKSEGKSDRVVDIYTSSVMNLEAARKAGSPYGVPGEIASVFKESYKPGGFGFTGTIAALFYGGFGLVAGAGAGAAGTTTGTVLSGFAAKVPWVVAGGMSGLVGAEIGLKKAQEDPYDPSRGADQLMPWNFYTKETGKLAWERGTQFAVAIGVGYAASRPTMFPKTQYHVTDAGGVTSVQRYHNVFGRPVHYGRTVHMKNINPDFTNYMGMPEHSGATFTPGKKGPYYPKQDYGFGKTEPIPQSIGLVPYQSNLPSTVVGTVPIKFSWVDIFPKDIRISLGVYKPDVFKITKPSISEKVIDFKGTPKDMMKPFEFREVMGKPKMMEDITKYEGSPFTKKEISDWMDSRIPFEKSLSTKVSPKPVVYRSNELVGFMGYNVTPFMSKSGLGLTVKTWGFKLKDLISKPKDILLGDSKPFVRAIDKKTGKQIGHEFFDIDSKPVVKTPKPLWESKPDYDLKPSQIHTPKELMSKKDFKVFETDDWGFRKEVSKKNVLKDWSRHSNKILGRSKFLHDFDTYKGEPVVGKKIVVRDPFGTTVAKQNYYLLFGSKPINIIIDLDFAKSVLKPEPIIKSFKGFKERTFSPKDITKKWEMDKSDVDKSVINLGGGKEGQQQQLLLKPPKIKTETKKITKQEQQTKQVRVQDQKVSTQYLKQLGRFDVDEYIRSDMDSGLKSSPKLEILPLVTPIKKSNQIFIQESKMGSSILSAQKLDPIFKTDLAPLVKVDTILGIKSKQAVKSDLALVQVSASIQASMQSQVQDVLLSPMLKSKLLEEKITKKKKAKFDLDDKIIEKMFSSHEQAYGVEVKKRQFVDGKRIRGTEWRRLKGKPLTERDATRFGAKYVDNNAKASFKLVEVEGKPGKPSGKLPSLFDVYDEFYQNKKGLWVEHVKDRIDSPGEIREITNRGIAANRNKTGSHSSRKKTSSGGFVDKKVDSMIKKFIGGKI